MSDESALWLRYAEGNRQAATVCFYNGLLNPSIQNAQQAVEKALKGLCLLKGIPLRRTHSITGLRHDLLQSGVDCGIDEEDCSLLDSVYLPSKYPLGAVLPDFDPD
jgi:HEPN domain-containing protein